MYATYRISLVALAAFWLSSAGNAAEQQPYKAMGAPAHPQVVARWNRYHDHAEATQLMLRIHQSGLGIAGVYVLEVAETKVAAVHRMAEERGYPLRAGTEQE